MVKPLYTGDDQLGLGLYPTGWHGDGAVLHETQDPYLFLLDNESLAHFCNYCAIPWRAHELKTCVGCAVATYCSKPCQRKAWEYSHKYECKQFREQRAHGRTLPSSTRALCTFLYRSRTRKDADSRSGEEVIKNLQTWRTDCDEHSAPLGHAWQLQEEDMLLESRMAQELMSFTGFTLDNIQTIYCGLKLNGFRAALPGDEKIGIAFDETVSAANHSCVPNAIVTFDGRKMSLRALQTVGPRKNGKVPASLSSVSVPGSESISQISDSQRLERRQIKEGWDEIRVSYIDVLLPKQERQDALLRNYKFKCTCPRCDGDLDPNEVFQLMPTKIINANEYSLAIDAKDLQRYVKSLCPRLSNFSFTNPNLYKEMQGPEQTFLSRYRLLAVEFQAIYDHWLSVSHTFPPHRTAFNPTAWPFVHMVGNMKLNYLQGKDWVLATILAAHSSYMIEPVTMPQPWHPARNAAIFALAKLLLLVAMPETPGQEEPTPLVAFFDHAGFLQKEARQLEVLPLIISLLYLCQTNMNMSHGYQSRFSHEVNDEKESVLELVTDGATRKSVELMGQSIMEGKGRREYQRLWKQLVPFATLETLLRVIAVAPKRDTAMKRYTERGILHSMQLHDSLYES